MAVQNFGLALMVLSVLIAGAYPAAISPVTSQEEASVSRDDDRVLSLVSNLEGATTLEGHVLQTDEAEAKRTEDDATVKSYVDASMFRHIAAAPEPEKSKPKGSVFVKKVLTSFNKYAKEEHEIKHGVKVLSKDAKPSKEADVSDEEVDDTLAAILGALRKTFDDADDRSVDKSVSTTVVSSTEVTAENSSTEATTPTNEDSEIPKLSPPIWLHSSAAEALSDPLRLPMIETFDRYDRYSHSIARDVFW